MGSDRIAHIVVAFAVAVITTGLALSARPAAAATDATGAWSASYSLACSASLTQSGATLSATVDCAGSVVNLQGTFDAMSRSISLTGDLTGFPVTVNATAAPDGATMSGTWSAPPLVSEGPFAGAREGAPMNPSDISGNWNFNVSNIFSGSCTVDIAQRGLSVSADVNCERGPSGTFTGSLDRATGNISLTGPFGQFGNELSMTVSLSDDGSSFNGIWVIVRGGPGGTIVGERLSGPAPTAGRTPTSARPQATPTTSIALPFTGGGTAGGGLAGWVYGAIAGALALSAASYVALRRVR